jgi:hypothetical protein
MYGAVGRQLVMTRPNNSKQRMVRCAAAADAGIRHIIAELLCMR